jgi:hypothetical protein
VRANATARLAGAIDAIDPPARTGPPEASLKAAYD